MKFATLALLFASVSAKRGGGGGSRSTTTTTIDPTDKAYFGLTPEHAREWIKLVIDNMERMDDLPKRSPLRKMWLKWMRGDAKKEIEFMKGEMYKDGGSWDQFAGDDGSMNFDEGKAMDHEIRFMLSKDFPGAEWPERPDGYFKRAYDAYDALSEGEGFTKEDAKRGDKIMERIREGVTTWKPTEEQKKAMRPVWEQEMQRFDDLPEGGPLEEFADKWLNGRARKEVKKVSKAMYKDGGPFDKAAGDDGMLSLEEARAFNDMFRKNAIQGQEVKGYTDEQFKLMFDAYDSLSEGNGISKEDAKLGQRVMENFRDHRIGSDEFYKFWALGQLQYDDYISGLDKESKARKMFDQWLENGPSDEEKEMMNKAFYDVDGTGRLDHDEWMTTAGLYDEMIEKVLGEDAPQWGRGEQEFFWTMANSVKDGHWNQWGSHADGVSKADLRRLNRIMREVLQNIVENEEGSDDEDFLLI